MKRTRGVWALAAMTVCAGTWGYGNRANAQLASGDVTLPSVEHSASASDAADAEMSFDDAQDGMYGRCGTIRASGGRTLTRPLRASEIDDPLAGQMDLLYDAVDQATRDDSGN